MPENPNLIRDDTPGAAGAGGDSNAAATSIEEEVLEIADIQGNILAGFNKDFQEFLFLRINDRDITKFWLSQITPSIASVAEVLPFNRMFSALRARRGTDPAGIVATWINIAFTFQGIKALTSEEEANQFRDIAFRLGLHEQAALIGDGGDGHPDKWVIGNKDKVPDILLIIASDDPTQLTTEVDRIKATIENLPKPQATPGKDALEILFEQSGRTRDDLPGHEHFGFKDGVSQPGIRGLVSNEPGDFLTKRLIDPEDQAALKFSKPGQPLIWPGQFVLGYKRQRADDPVQPGSAAVPSPNWAGNGSYLVVRRLLQNVHGFWSFIQTKTQELAAKPAFTGLTKERLATLLVGRWPSGAPLMRSPQTDNTDMAGNGFANNHFNFSADTEPVQLVPIPGHNGDNFPQASSDNAGHICPHVAHIRKMNPRDLGTDSGGANDTRTRLVLRRGIPFGKPMKDPLNPAPEELKEERGLMFLCYQASIVNQFTFVTRRWANIPNVPESGGPDPIIGQRDQGGGNRTRTIELLGADGSTEKITLPIEWITPTGGGYFFAPSISALRDVLSK